MSFKSGGNIKARGEWSVWLLAAVCALLLAAPAQSTPLVAPSALAHDSLSCANVLAWLHSSDESATSQERRAVLLQALCAAGALDRHEAENLLTSLEARELRSSSGDDLTASADFSTDNSALLSCAHAPRTLATRGDEYSLSLHEAAFLNGVRTNRWLK